MEEKKPTSLVNEEIQAKLDKKLGPEYISKRIGFGSSRVAYIEGWRAINLANQIFGYNGWSTEVKNVTIDFLDERQGKFSIGCTAIVRVTLANGTYREDIGYGTVENERRKPAAFERAKKSAVTDALKRALRGFGNALGNCLYDKDFLSKIDKVKFDPPDFDEGNLFRPSDEISENSRSNTMDASDSAVPTKRRQIGKIGVPHNNIPIETPQQTNRPIRNAASIDQQNKQNTSMSEPPKTGPAGENVPPTTAKSEQDDLLDDSFMFSDDFQDDDLMDNEEDQVLKDTMEVPLVPPASRGPIINEPVTFVTAKAATTLQNKAQVTDDSIFDPKYQAQSIKHTIDQTTSKHVPADTLKEKGVSPSREELYQKFAPKGKQLDSNTTNHQQTESPESSTTTAKPSSQQHAFVTNQTTQKPSTTAQTSRFAPPSKVIHPNPALSSTMSANSSKSMRREIGRPKINPLQMRKPTP
ncbi:recombinase RAD52 NDAI_0C00800 [Naumovozyma dairenensis CBS 421]|uniref:DNA repair and recombination protein RAD52 n=1 Tax=Naumovozyma dairenensis (strain ATCC 10597 / BCRC 20456 / CBS 421 / NBRC 0211 / NRRL Y-12639) TaxID=1071378 RepID=G0W7I0_NAUDC|nr:hypothetical protein NDAI_0C00800 [Naumovozyma dairenensis CBS 421]CCD23741.1 hypothetical protein NDAI_0C00800 [Naumovozyma dairenensis CBS 421]